LFIKPSLPLHLKTLSVFFVLKQNKFTQMKKLTLLFTLISFAVVAQKNYQKGYLINTRKDTIKGLIDYQEWQKSPLSINFKENGSSQEKTVVPQDIISFTVQGVETYVSKTFEYEKLPRNFTKSSFLTLTEYAKRTKVMKSQSAFLRLLSDGNIQLMTFIDSDEEEHFLIEKGKEVTTLVFHVVGIGNNATDLNQYRNQLQNVLEAKCATLYTEMVPYKAKALQNLIDNYNGCIDSKKVENFDQDEGRFQFGVMAGLSVSSSPYISRLNVAENAPWFYTPIAGVFLNYVFARERGKVAIQNEIQNYRFETKYAITGFTYNTLYTFDKTYIGVNNLVKYSFVVDKPSVYMLAGISSLFEVSDKSYKQLIGFGSGEKRDIEVIEPKYKPGLIFGVGSTWDRFGIEARYSLITAITTFDNFTGLKKEISIVGRYYIKK
jgi:hypothetical protein